VTGYVSCRIMLVMLGNSGISEGKCKKYNKFY